MAENEKVILDVNISYNVQKLKDKANSAKSLQKKQAALDADEQEALDAELEALKKQEAADLVRTQRRKNLIFVTDEPNGRTRKKCPVATVVPGLIYSNNGNTIQHTVRPPLNLNNRQIFDYIELPNKNELPYIFVTSLDQKTQLPTPILVETAGDNAVSLQSKYPEVTSYDNVCLHPYMQHIFEQGSNYTYEVSFNCLLPVEGVTCIYLKYTRYWFSYIHSYVIKEWQNRLVNGCYEQIDGTYRTVQKGSKRKDLWTGTTAEAFLVGSSSIKKIAFPSKVKDALKKITGEPSYRDRVQTMYDENDSRLTEYLYNYDKPPWIDSIYNSEVNQTYFPGLLWNYGFGAYESTLHGDERFFSPAIYSFIKQYSGEYQGQDVIQDYDTIKDLYKAKPTAFLTLGDFTIEPNPNDLSETTHVTQLMYTTTRPSNITLPLEEDTEKTFILRKCPNQIRVRYKQEDGLSESAPLYAWDWGHPAYCYSEARSLGFSEEDLRF